MDVNKIINNILTGDFHDVKKLIKKKPHKVNEANSDGETFLMAASQRGSIELLSLLIESGASLDESDEMGRTALCYAVDSNQSDAVAFLISRGTDVNKQDPRGNTPLHRAVEKNYEDVVKVLLNSRGNNILQVNQGNYFGWTPLHSASSNGHTDIVKLLLQQPGTDVRSVSKGGRTPLHLASFYGRTDTVKLLLQQNGVDTNVVDINGCTPLHLAVEKQHYNAVTSMLSQVSVKLDIGNKKKLTPLLEAITRGHLGIIHKLITQGADINAVDKEGNNCLHLTVKRDTFHSEVEHIRILDECCTELQLSMDNRFSAIVVVGYLAKKGANLYHRNNNKVTPLDCIENENLKERLRRYLPLLCRWCQEEKATVTLHPCQHTVLCKNCCSEMTFKRCPMCRERIVNISGFESPKFEEKEDHTVKEPDESLTLEERHLNMVSRKLAGKWQQLGRELGLKQDELDIIKHDYSLSIVEQGFQMLLKWFRSCDPAKRTFHVLTESLRVTECYPALDCLASNLPSLNKDL